MKNGNTGKGRDPIARVFLFGAIGLSVLLLVAIWLIVSPSFIKPTVATIGSEKVKLPEFTYYLNLTKQSMFSRAQQDNPSLTEQQFWATPINGKNAVDVAKENTMSQIQEIKIQVSKAKEKNIKLEKTDLDYMESIFSSMISQYGDKKTADEAYKAQYGITTDDMKDIYKEALLRNKLYEAEEKDVKTDDIKDFYDNNKDKYVKTDMRPDGGEAVWARHILVKVPDNPSQTDWDKAKTKAQGILDKVKAGEDFVKLVKENSEDPGSVDMGGAYVFGNGQMVPEFENAAFALNPGQVSELVKTDYGYHIIKLEEKYAKDEPVSLKCAQDYFGVDLVKSSKFQEKLNSWKKDAAYAIKYNNRVYDPIK